MSTINTQMGTAAAVATTEECVTCTVPFDQIQTPGAYVCQWSGHLLRVPPDATPAGASPALGMIGHQRLWVTKISDNPYLSLTKARLLAANNNLHVSF